MKMTLNEAITIARKCLHCDNSNLQSISYTDRCKAYDVIAEYHYKISLLENNKGATEDVLMVLGNIK